MKRIILVLVAILISTNTLHAANFKWTKIETSDDGEMTVYVDKKTVFRVFSQWNVFRYSCPSQTNLWTFNFPYFFPKNITARKINVAIPISMPNTG